MQHTENYTITHEDIVDGEFTEIQPSINAMENGDELRAMGFRDISKAGDYESQIRDEILNSVQIQRTLQDYQRNSSDKRSTRDYLKQHIDFLVNVSPGKTKKDIVSKMTIEHAAAIMKIAAKADVPEKLLKKHLKHLKKEYT
jgi:hypothetical protein